MRRQTIWVFGLVACGWAVIACAAGEPGAASEPRPSDIASEPRPSGREAPGVDAGAQQEERRRSAQVLREAYELLEDKDWTAAVRALQKLVQRTPPTLLEELNSACQRERGEGLAELLARLRLREAHEQAGDEPITLRFATRYESAALGELMQQEYEQLLAQRFGGRSVRAWAGAIDEYDSLTPQSQELVLTARRAAGLISGRLRADHALRERAQERRALMDLRSEIARLVARVSAMTGFQKSDRFAAIDDPASRKARELAEEAASQPSWEGEAIRRPPVPSDDFPDPARVRPQP